MTPRWALWNFESETWDEVPATATPGDWHGGHSYGNAQLRDAAVAVLEALCGNDNQGRLYSEFLSPELVAATEATERALLPGVYDELPHDWPGR